MEQTPSAKRNPTLGWVLGMFFLLIGFAMAFSSVISGSAVLVLGLLLLPPSRQWFEGKINRTFPSKAIWVMGIALFMIAGAALPSSSSTSTPPIASNTNTVAVKPEPVEPEEVVVFDLEALYGKNIDEIRDILGEPTDATQMDPTPLQTEVGITEWDNNFEKDGYELLVTYDSSTRSVIDFFIATNDPSGLTKDVESLKGVGNVKNTIHYTFEPVQALKDKSSYTGIIITPKSK